eukprot:390464-Pleurochrysis_carterae.AAC.1
MPNCTCEIFRSSSCECATSCFRRSGNASAMLATHGAVDVGGGNTLWDVGHKGVSSRVFVFGRAKRERGRESMYVNYKVDKKTRGFWSAATVRGFARLT